MSDNNAPQNNAGQETVTITPSTVSNAAKKTIKLKPLIQRSAADDAANAAAPATSGADFRSTATAPMKPLKKRTVNPAAGLETQVVTMPSQSAAKFMSTATGPIHQVQPPAGGAPVTPGQIGAQPQNVAKFMSTATGPIHQVQPPAGGAPVTPGQIGAQPQNAAKFMSTATGPIRTNSKADQTVTQVIHRIKPSKGPAASAPTEAEKPAVKLRPATGGPIPHSASGIAGVQTIRLAPKPASAISPMPSAAPAVPANGQTIRLAPKPASAIAPMPSTAPAGVPTAPAAPTVRAKEETIKLTPEAASAKPPVPPANEPETIVLTPTNIQTTIAVPSSSTASDPTIKLPGVQAPAAPSFPKPPVPPAPPTPPAGLSLKKEETPAPPAPPAPPTPPAGLSLKKEESPAPPAPAPAPEEDRSTLNVQDPSKNKKGQKVDLSDEPLTMVHEDAEKKANDENKEPKTAPETKAKDIVPPEKKESFSIISFVAAVLAFIVIAYVVFAMAAQYFNAWSGTNIPVVGFEQIHQAVCKK